MVVWKNLEFDYCARQIVLHDAAEANKEAKLNPVFTIYFKKWELKVVILACHLYVINKRTYGS